MESNAHGAGDDGLQLLVERDGEQESLMEGLLGDHPGPLPRSLRSRLLSRLCRVRSAPALETIKAAQGLGSSPAQESRMKHLDRAARGLPPPSPFQRDGEGMSTLVKAIIALGIYLLVGLLSFFLLELKLQGDTTSPTVDALYFAIVTMTTVGYGDLVPDTVGAKLFTCAFVFTGFGLVGVILSGAASYLVEKQEKLLVQKIYLRYKRKEHKKELVVDGDDDQVVAAHWKLFVAGVAVVVHFAAGMFALMWWEGMSFVDGFYLVCVTVTTLGYGDRSFRTQGGRIFAIVWILSSTVCVAQFFLYLAESRTEERQHEIACWALHRPTTPSDLEAADMDGDGVVSAAEFVIFKLKEEGKIAEEDVQDILKEFVALDYDESGTLNVSDIHMSSLAKERT